MKSTQFLHGAAVAAVSLAVASAPAIAHDDPQKAAAPIDDEIRAVADEAVHAALERRLSEHALTWEIPGVVSGEVKPLRTWQSVSGHWCRQFEERVVLTSGVEHRARAVACRIGGQWERAN